MPKDYAKKTNTSKRRPKRNTKNTASTPIWLWFVSIIIIAAFVTGVFYLHKHKWRQTHKSVTHKTTQQPTTNKAPHFEFYSMLSSGESPEANQTNVKPTRNIPVISIKSMANPASYSVQIASFKQHKPADELKAKLALQGMDVTINKSSHDNWYRVVAGPYNDQVTADNIKRKLQKAGYNVILHKQPTS